MVGKHSSLILLPTLACNAACDYCFENKVSESLSLDRLSVLIEKVLDYLQDQHVEGLTIYWQGGEVMMLPPQWYEKAYDSIQKIAERGTVSIRHSMQTNMIGYRKEWNPIIAEMFGNEVGSSMDFPNRHRKVVGGSAEEYTKIWLRNVREAREAGIGVHIIAVPNAGTIEAGADALYAYFLDELELPGFQLNTPFPGGAMNAVKQELPLNTDALSQFYVELANVWMERGYQQGIRISPFDQFLQYFLGEETCISCIWRENCTDEFLCIDARGAVAQCDCWVTSYPDYWFGNIFECSSLGEMLQTSRVRWNFLKRPEKIIEHEDCLECDYLAICHGGCPIRAYSITGELYAKDPYCPLYKSLFSCMEGISAQLAGIRASAAS